MPEVLIGYKKMVRTDVRRGARFQIKRNEAGSVWVQNSAEKLKFLASRHLSSHPNMPPFQSLGLSVKGAEGTCVKHEADSSPSALPVITDNCNHKIISKIILWIQLKHSAKSKVTELVFFWTRRSTRIVLRLYEQDDFVFILSHQGQLVTNFMLWCEKRSVTST